MIAAIKRGSQIASRILGKEGMLQEGSLLLGEEEQAPHESEPTRRRADREGTPN